VSMFPRWSETFVLNELVEHEKSGIDLSIFSIKKCNEKLVHDKSIPFIEKTIYIEGWFWIKIWFLHLFLLSTKPSTYFSLLYIIFTSARSSYEIKLKCIIVFFYAPYFCRVAKNQSVDHLHAHFVTYPSLLSWIISKFESIPFSFTAHAHDIYLCQDILKIVANDAKEIVTISQYNKNIILNTLNWTNAQQTEKVKVIHCGIDVSIYQFDEAENKFHRGDRPLRIISVARLCEIKGFRYLLDALFLLKQEGYVFLCDIIGDGPLKEELLEQTKALNLDSCVTFLGAKKADEVHTFVREADLFVLACATSKNEGQDGIPVVFMEAMALGTPVIGTNISGVPELIIDEVTGLCAEPENPVSLKNKMVDIVRENKNLSDMTKRARLLIDNEFNIEKNSKILRNLFESELLN
jgi:colanic acid/amylovoran biosynthesis glycosyltransferase